MRIRLLSLILLSILLASCDAGLDGQLNENQPPKTFLTVSDINLPEGERLVSQVSISWWGDDPDGFIVGYELIVLEESLVPVDPEGNLLCELPDDFEPNWTFTTRTDSTFIMPIEEGNPDADVAFLVRAVDNDNTVDPDPPCLIFPVRNSPPDVNFRPFETPPDTTYRIASFGWLASDPDGDANLNRLEVALNDTTNGWHTLDVSVNFLTMRIDDTIEPPTADVFTGRAVNNTDIVFNSINLDDMNTFYIRAVDNAGAISPVREYEWYVKKQRSRVLYIDDFPGSAGDVRRDLHLETLAAAGIDVVDILVTRDGTPTGGRRVPLSNSFPDRSLAAPTINMMLAEWDHIYWVSNNLDRNIGYALELTFDFFDNGGTMFINIPTTDVATDNDLFEFLPVQGFEPVPSGNLSFVIETNSEAIPDPSVSDPPQLIFRRPILNVRPLIPFGETQTLFEADFKVRPVFGSPKPFEGNKLISATNSGENIIYFSVDFTEFTSDSDLTRLVEITCKEILGFQQ